MLWQARYERNATSAAHGYFDWIWQDRHKTRSEAYAWLASKLGIPVERCHIGEFDVPTCRRVVEVCEAFRGQLSLGGESIVHCCNLANAS